MIKMKWVLIWWKVWKKVLKDQPWCCVVLIRYINNVIIVCWKRDMHVRCWTSWIHQKGQPWPFLPYHICSYIPCHLISYMLLHATALIFIHAHIHLFIYARVFTHFLLTCSCLYTSTRKAVIAVIHHSFTPTHMSFRTHSHILSHPLTHTLLHPLTSYHTLTHLIASTNTPSLSQR